MRRIFTIIKAISLLVFAALTVSCSHRRDAVLDSGELSSICNMALLECYYHNVVLIDETAGVIRSKDYTLWLDYTAVLKLGIDSSQLDMDVNGTEVAITLPKPEILGKPKILAESMKFYSSEGATTRISVEEQLKSLEKAKDEMIADLNTNKSVMQQAETRAKSIIRGYVERIGELQGVEYAIRWKMMPEAL